MTTNLFVIANVKQLRTYVDLQFYCLFSNILVCWRLKFSIFISFQNRVVFGKLLEGLRNIRGLLRPKTPLWRHWLVVR